LALGWSKNLNKIFIRIKINYVLNKIFVNIINYIFNCRLFNSPSFERTKVLIELKKTSMNAWSGGNLPK